ncbi:MAG: PAS domain S-box protein [Methanoregula sp.]|uniref:PAS domain-containing protein n=1 Tax=Methanoregula sp. TaxID=2052170 RepID=UPI003C7116DC
MIQKIKAVVSHRQAEASIRNHERHEADILNFLPDATFAIDKTGTVIAWNHAMEKMTGIKLSEILGKGNYEYSFQLYHERRPMLIDLILAPDVQFEKDRYLYTIHDSTNLTAESILEKPDGTQVNIWEKASLFFNEIGNLTGAIESIRDINEHRQLEEGLRQSERRYYNLYRDSTLGIFHSTLDGRFIDVNPAFARLLGYASPEETVATITSIADQVYFEPPQYDAVAKAALDAGGVLNTITRYRRKDGALWYGNLHLHIVTDKNGTPSHYEGFVEDITKRKRLEEELTRSMHQLGEAMDLAHLVNWEFDVATATFTFDDRFYALLGTTADREGGYLMKAETYVREFLHPDDQHILDEEVKRALETTNPDYQSAVVHRIIRRDGEVRYIIVKIRVTKDAQGRTIKTYGANQDITDLKRAEEKLQRSEERFRSVLDNSSDVIYRQNLQTRHYEYYSPSCTALYGFSPQEMIDMDEREARERVHPDDRARLDAALTHLTDSGHEQVDIRWKIRSGEYRWLSAVMTLVKDPSGKHLYRDGFVRDITERKNAELLLVESEKKYRWLLEGLHDSVLVHRDTRILYLNPACEKMLGYPRDALLGQSIMMLVPPELREMVANASRKRMAGETFEPYELDLIRGDDSRISVIMSGNLVVFEGAPASINLIIDISSRKRAGQALQESEKRLYSIYNTVEDVIFQLKVEPNEQYRFTSVNLAFSRVTGLPAEHVIGRNVNEIIPEPSLTTVLEKYRQAIKEKAIVHWEEISNYPTGQLTGDVSVAPIFDETGNCSHLIGSVHDITERKRAENALNQANRKLNLLSGITRHDITNQLTTLQGYLAILEMNRNDPNFKEYLQKAKTTAEHISATIKFTKEYESIGVNAPVWQDCRVLVDTAATQVPLDEVMMINDLPAGTEVFADPLVQKVFYNLIDNARRYGGSGMTKIRFFSSETGNGLILSCEDNGDGITGEDKKRLFERGFGKNTGLGLFLSREILSITGITITENGVPGKGARFEIMVPEGAYRIADAQ